MREKLEQAGLRVTRQRMMIADLLFAKGDRHVTAEKLFEEVVALKVAEQVAGNFANPRRQRRLRR